MNERTYDELESKSSDKLKETFSQITQKQAESVIHRQLENLKAQDKVLILSDEEERMLASFRRFKAKMRKPSEIFTWQTRRADGVIEAPERFLIEDPQEVA